MDTTFLVVYRGDSYCIGYRTSGMTAHLDGCIEKRTSGWITPLEGCTQDRTLRWTDLLEGCILCSFRFTKSTGSILNGV